MFVLDTSSVVMLWALIIALVTKSVLIPVIGTAIPGFFLLPVLSAVGMFAMVVAACCSIYTLLEMV